MRLLLIIGKPIIISSWSGDKSFWWRNSFFLSKGIGFSNCLFHSISSFEKHFSVFLVKVQLFLVIYLILFLFFVRKFFFFPDVLRRLWIELKIDFKSLFSSILQLKAYINYYIN